MKPHPNLSDAINHNILQSEKDGGLWLKKLLPGHSARITTTSGTSYIIHRGPDSSLTIEGHPEFCPREVACSIPGSTWGGSMIKVGFVGLGMHMEFWINRECYTTTPVKRIEVS